MTISELITALQKFPQDVEVLTHTGIGTLIRTQKYGLVHIIPVVPGSRYDKRRWSLEPGNEWREPINSNDEPEIERVYGFVI